MMSNVHDEGDVVADLRKWISTYNKRYEAALFGTDVVTQISQFSDIVKNVRHRDTQMLLAGNGASAAIASHAAVDFTKQAGVRASTFNEADLITCFANDYGYDRWMAKAVEFYAKPGDAVVLISCSGKSPSVVNAAETAKTMGLKIVTFTGFAADNPLKMRGDVNFWLDSRAYNIIECVHMIWITTVIDLIIGKAEYTVS